MKKKFLNSKDFRKLKVGEVIRRGDIAACKDCSPSFKGEIVDGHNLLWAEGRAVKESDFNWYYRPIKHRRKMVVVTV